MVELRFALIGEGNTDEALMPIIHWLLREYLSPVDIVGIWANVEHAPVPRPRTLAERIARTIASVPSHVLFVHRDADSAGRVARVDEISRAVTGAQLAVVPQLPVIAVVPVRETEAWLLFDEPALGHGARNPNGHAPLALPRPSRIESISDPKRSLRDLIHVASELQGRHRARLTVDPVRVANSIADFSPLRQLPAFQALEADVRQVITEQGWPERLG